MFHEALSRSFSPFLYFCIVWVSHIMVNETVIRGEKSHFTKACGKMLLQNCIRLQTVRATKNYFSWLYIEIKKKKNCKSMITKYAALFTCDNFLPVILRYAHLNATMTSCKYNRSSALLLQNVDENQGNVQTRSISEKVKRSYHTRQTTFPKHRG